MVNRERLADRFKCLVQIDSVSKSEAKVCAELKGMLEAMGAETVVDGAGQKVGSDSGNLIAKFKGNTAAAPMLLSAHMDTVAPGKGIVPRLKDGIFTSTGVTILGADDKSAIAILLEAISVLQENNLPHGPLELALTICEEIGLQGAKHLDFSQLTATFGYVLDATDTEGIITRAPSANRLEFIIHGKDAHAGAAPEKGINAIYLAAKALAKLKIGRIDRETTANIGVIEGGLAINIVPDLVRVKGEVRSHDEAKLNRVTQEFVGAFEQVVDEAKAVSPDKDLPRLESMVEKDFSFTHIDDDHLVVTLAKQAAENLGRSMVTKPTGGGADANIFFEHGIMTGVLGTGMQDMHTVRENVGLDDMVQVTELLLEIIRLHNSNP